MAALGSLVSAAVVVGVLVLSSAFGSGSGSSTGVQSSVIHGATPSTHRSGGAAQRGRMSVPILEYHVINVPPPGSGGDSSMYVPVAEFSAQMAALKADGWHAVTLDQLEASWTAGSSLGSGTPLVVTFDSGYASHYTNALPVLKSLGWVGVEHLELNGLSPSDGGLTDAQVRGLISAGWELDAQAVGGGDLTTLDAGQLADQVASARQTLRERFGRSVNWFAYPLGDYDASVIAAVRAAGFVGALTGVPGWATVQQDRYRLPRLSVRGGTSPQSLLAQIAAAKTLTSIPSASSGSASP